MTTRQGGSILTRLRKFLVLSLVLLLALSGGFVPKQAYAGNRAFLDAARAKLEAELSDRKVSEVYAEFFQPEDEVRIVVELTSKPGVVIATGKDKSYSSLSVTETKKIESALKAEQEAVKTAILGKSVKMEFKNSFTVAMNGFSGIVKFKDIAVIEKLTGVKHVYLSNEYEKPAEEPNMLSSGSMVNAAQTWNLDLKGEGQIIAIIDTGIDFNHRDMILSEGVEGELTAEEVGALGLKGKYFTEKVPYGYNYFDLSMEVIDKGPGASMHGMHVAGTAGANGDTENGGIKGIAPEAQLLAMKVFSNDPLYPSTFSDIYMVAIDEAIKLGADVLNMSLGSTAGFASAEAPEAVALQNAVDNGIVASVSAGNSGTLTYGWTGTYYGYPWKSNPDVGVVGSPGLNAPTISVASIENTNQMMPYLTYLKAGVPVKAPMAVAGPTDPAKALPADVEYVYGGLGTPAELTGVAGKVALIIRGSLNFVDKITNAANAGAIGVIIYNNAGGGNALINMAYPETLKIPAVFIGNTAGVDLYNLAEKKVTFSSEFMSVSNPNAGRMSTFSSWGTTPALEIKPEITAPGGMIFSTFNNNSYGTMSGTSMAAPHVAGGSALVMQYLESNPKFANLTAGEKTRMAKILLMNTADSVLDKWGYDVSPRSQGAGLMNLFGAVTTPVTLVNATTGEAKVELKDFETKTITLRLKASNHTDAEVTYTVDTTVLEDYADVVGTMEVIGLGSDYVNAAVDAPETVVVPANGSKEFTVTIDFSADTTVTRNMFVEGFVHLVDPLDVNPTVGVPFVGFYGDWDEPAIIDGLDSSDAFGPSYFQYSDFGLEYEGSYYFNGDENLFISPGTETGAMYGTDNVLPILSFLRNAEQVNYKITKTDGTPLRTLLTSNWVTKNFINGGTRNPYTLVANAKWDGKVKGAVVADGEYIYEITAKVQGSSEYQTYKRSVTVDTKGPEVEIVSYDEATRTLTFKATDAGAGLGFFLFAVNGTVQPGQLNAAPGQDTYTYTLPVAAPDVSTVDIAAFDYIYNMTEVTAELPMDVEPVIYIMEPLTLDFLTEGTVSVSGYVTNVNYLDKVLLNGTVEATVEYLPSVVVKDPEDPATTVINGPAFKFSAVLDLPDGYKEMKVEAITNNGNVTQLTRRFYVDTTAPTLTYEVLDRVSNSAEATIRFTLKDNLDYLKLYEDDSQIFLRDGFEELYIVGAGHRTFDYKVNLVDGENVFNFTLEDAVGHTTSETITIVKEIPEVALRYRGHVQNIGWQGYVENGAVSGTTGQSLRLEALNIEVLNSTKLGIKYATHVQDYGWQDPVMDGALSGTTGKSLRGEAVTIELTGTDAGLYDIYYQVHVQDFGWLGWAKNGAPAGTTGRSLRMEAVKIVVVPKGAPAPGSTTTPFNP